MPRLDESAIRKGLTGLKYNMLDVNKTVAGCVANPGKECADIKKLSHGALSTARDQMNAGQTDKANSSFAFAYQMRCVADWIWKNAMGKSGDLGHATYLALSRDFGKLAAAKRPLTDKEKKEIIKRISKIKD